MIDRSPYKKFLKAKENNNIELAREICLEILGREYPKPIKEEAEKFMLINGLSDKKNKYNKFENNLYNISYISLKEINKEECDEFSIPLKIVKDITSKGFVRNNYKKNLVDLSDVKISLKGKK